VKLKKGVYKMLYKYCPNCFSLDIKFDSNENSYKCSSCGYKGEIKKDTIDKINVLRKQNTSNQTESKFSNINTKFTKKDDLVSIDQKIKTKFGDKSNNSDWELL
jgi:DNA-directed RNA polymerase subunit M/transcription elongation factor TFIIS